MIEAETAAYFNKDYEGWTECWVHAPYIRRIGWFARCGVLTVAGWERESAAMWASMGEFPMPSRSAGQVRRENLNIRVDHDMAWVTFEQVAPCAVRVVEHGGIRDDRAMLQQLAD